MLMDKVDVHAKLAVKLIADSVINQKEECVCTDCDHSASGAND